MNIGLCSLFPFRPHVQNLAYVYKLLKTDNHRVRLLHCRDDFELCHYKIFNANKSRFIPPCYKCRMGSLANYVEKADIDYISNIKSIGTRHLYKNQDSSAINSLANIHRIENYNKLKYLEDTEEFSSLLKSKQRMSKIIHTWVERENLDLIVLFNGRMDLLDSVLGELNKMGIETLCVEGSGTDRGIRVVPNRSAINYSHFDKSFKKAKDRPLTPPQQLIAFSYLYNRITGNNDYEWRQYNINENISGFQWETKPGKKVLILPSSKYEFYGVIDQSSTWNNTIDGLDYVLDILDVKNDNILLKFHPNWSRDVAGYDGSQSTILYKEYCEKREMSYINSDVKVETRDLIKEADYIIVNGGSSAIEATLLGKQVINVFPHKYMNAGFVDNVINKDASTSFKFDENEQFERVRNCLRYLFFNMRIYPKLTDKIISDDTVTNKYKMQVDSNFDVLDEMRELDLDPYKKNATNNDENAIIDDILNRKFEELGKKLCETKRNKHSGYDTIEPNGFAPKIIKELRSKFNKGDQL